ncbi:hypothetical protein LRY65_05370 [Candidatus Woesebacteria bacterium]|nr:hypothetical protein [Candidatus Woesebacteria bacterium]MCD8506694.1 hypothetical protein [Candidatus Woesebacteria bacterium]MCD8527599.1 hypothetical protein [Candidatus Woesebacteria bacterium]MCD8546429.1 hypothetical protein [Candidatus Woesebacteria bacterium]
MINLAELIATKQPKVGNTIFIAIDGHGGSGKSTFSDWLSKRLDAELVHTDDFASWDNPLNWWPIVIDSVFKQVSNGAKELNYPRSQWWEGHSREPISQTVTEIMILEGVSSLRMEFRDYISLGIFVDTPKEVCLQRGVKRDLQFGKSREEVVQMWESFYTEEDNYINRDLPKEYADLILDGTKPFEIQVEL